jgi:agmatinase
MTNANRNAFIGSSDDYAASAVVIFGAGADATTSYRPGTRFGPAAIRQESYGIETYSPALGRDLEDVVFFDSGDLEFPFGSPGRQLAAIEERAAEILADGKVPFMLGGEHLVTLGAVRAAARKHPDLRIIHFDAHADLREDYLGESLSHASVIRRCHDLLGDGRIFQFGIRSGTREEFAFMKAGHVTAEPFDDTTLDAVIASLNSQLSNARPSNSPMPVYLTIDMDVLDPSEFPGTGTQEAGGFSYLKLLADMRKVCRGCRIVGIDNVELNPTLDPSGRSAALACKFLREEILELS